MNRVEKLTEAILKAGISARQAGEALRNAILGLNKIKQAPKHNHKRKPAGHGNKRKKR